MRDKQHVLSATERADLLQVLRREEPASMLLHGEGDFRNLSFYAEGTRLEARIPYPAPSADDEERARSIDESVVRQNVVRQISEWLRGEEAARLAATADGIAVSVPAVLAHAIADGAWRRAE